MNCLAFRCKINILAQYKLILFLAMAEGVIPVLIVYLSKTMIQALLDFQSYPILLLLAGLISLSYFVEKICVIYRSIKIKDRLTKTKSGYLKNIISTYCKTNLIFAESEEAIKAKEAAINAIEFNDSIKNYLDAVCKLISGVISMAGAIYIVFTLNFFLIFIVILVFIPEFWINSKKKKIDYANMKKWGELNRKTNCYSSLLTEIKTIKELKVFQAGRLVQDSIEENDKKRTAEMLKQEKKHSCLDMMFFLCKTIGDGLIYCYLAVKLWAGEIQISQFALFIGGINTMSNSINNLSEAYVGLKQYNAFLSDYTGFILSTGEMKPLTKDEKIHTDNQIKKIEFINVSFAYPGQNRYVLDNISTVIYPHQSISIVGRNGAGKTTFIKLLLGLYKPDKGQILINDIDINSYSRSELKSVFSVLFQDYNIFPVTVFENVALKERTEEADLSFIYHQVGIKERIDALPNLDDTVLSTEFEENGVDLSGGQKLKLAIARAIYSDCPFLVLDEPSAALDSQAEFEFYQMIYNMNKTKTILFVSHRMTSSKFCNRILVFDNGHIVGDGNHHELYNTNEIYTNLVNAQRCEQL